MRAAHKQPHGDRAPARSERAAPGRGSLDADRWSIGIIKNRVYLGRGLPRRERQRATRTRRS